MNNTDTAQFLRMTEAALFVWMRSVANKLLTNGFIYFFGCFFLQCWNNTGRVCGADRRDG
ncbi:hypothetical protein D7Z54_31915 [Salibacterium salarium]|uniref:Uncharacterized protein n=1 Tax=Salibacterium salarium TaxID=284579 RepID=A0A428MT52_9BACI|nr:hypothetical protein D7Z54_31915 [Salibacterium salarium]